MSGVLRDSSEASRTVWIVRHGEREDHVDQEWHLRAPRGAVDDPELSSRGRIQAQEAGVRLVHEAIDNVVTSPFIRCLQTTQEILKMRPGGLKVPLFVEPGYGEQTDVCAFPPDYLPLSQAKYLFPQIDLDYKPALTDLPLKEDDCTPRVWEVLEGLLKKLQGNILIVSHGSPIESTHEVLVGDKSYPGLCTISSFKKEAGKDTFRRMLNVDKSHLKDKTNLHDVRKNQQREKMKQMGA
ncbi:hypothetical protein L596_009974 [Steinernema carpocapsae]|uniref:Phosphoglycerate mutase family protein n=1 Tax=Steinernema carpocapsae TaxID=34508 RepID=A0A4U5PGY0_STECR|nr:hypothetical protein L596_009974 [Steinernema carpocapsae]